MSDTLKSKAEVMSHVAGVLGFVLALALAVPQVVEFTEARRLKLRLVTEPEVPFASVRGIPRASDSVIVALYHDGGHELRIDTVVLRIPRQRQSLANDGSSIVGGGFSDGGMWEIGEDATFYYLWQVDGAGDVMPSEVRALPFGRGDTRYYSAPVAGPIVDWRSRPNGAAATIDVWSQGRVLRSFDVSEYLTKRSVKGS